MATLCGTVEAPTPPLAPTKATVRPSGAAAGSANSDPATFTTSAIVIGATRYSEMPRRVRSR